jgi:hypothetical protein
MLSPQWSSVLKADSSPSSFGRKDVRKVAVLMSDGEYNFTYDADGGPSSSVGGTGSNGSGSINRLSSAAQAVQVCAQMKSSGIEVYTVGFQLGGNQTAIDTLRECASSASSAYNAESGEELKNAFRDIALKVSSLYLSN